MFCKIQYSVVFFIFWFCFHACIKIIEQKTVHRKTWPLYSLPRTWRVPLPVNNEPRLSNNKSLSRRRENWVFCTYSYCCAIWVIINCIIRRILYLKIAYQTNTIAQVCCAIEWRRIWMVKYRHTLIVYIAYNNATCWISWETFGKQTDCTRSLC